MWTQDDINTLKGAVATGVLEVRYDGPPARTVIYQSLSEMRALLASMAQEVAVASGKSLYSVVSTSKGFGGNSNAQG